MKSGVTVIDHKQEFYDYLDKFIGSGKLGKNLSIFEKEGKIELLTDKIDFDNDKDTWCGTVFVKIKKMTTEEVINYIIGVSGADEISMEKKILRLWWDFDNSLSLILIQV